MKILLETINAQFDKTDARARALLAKIQPEMLFVKPRRLERSFIQFSCGEYLLRSAAAVEQSFGGITRRLWDDPFEWTLPEELATNEKIIEYLAEVEATRRDGWAFFTSDEDLKREMPAPEKLKTIFEILIETLARAEHFQGRAFAVFQMLSDEKLPRI